MGQVRQTDEAIAKQHSGREAAEQQLPRSLFFAILSAAVVLMACSSLRHNLFQSNAYDLGIFDQAVYLISAGVDPIVSLIGFHALGDHAAFVLYPLALLYKIFPSVYWLLAVQAIALASGAFFVWHLALDYGLKRSQAIALSWVYLLYPVVFNANLFDFHPEVIAVPALFGTIWAARRRSWLGFITAVALVLSCKAVLSLTVAALGLWLLFAQQRSFGVVALALGITWFGVSTQVVIPAFSGEEAQAVGRYSYLGDSVLGILQNLLLKPQLALSYLFTPANLEYLVLLLVPFLWGLSPRHLLPLLGAGPTLFLNLLADHQPQKDLTHQYALPMLPFFLVAIMAALAAERGLLRRPRWIVVWATVAWLALAKYGYFGSLYLSQLDTVGAMRGAIAQVQTQGGVLTASQIAPHLTHRALVTMAEPGSENMDLADYRYALLNEKHPGWASSPETVQALTARLSRAPDWQRTYEQDGVVLFEAIIEAPAN